MSARIELLKQAGFSDAEIGDWATAERQRMHEAGFSDDEIDEEFGVTRPPKDLPPAFIERLKQGNALQRIAGAAGDYAERYFGDEPLGFSPKNQEFLHKLGVAGDIVIPAARPVDAALRAVPAGIAAVGAGLGQAVEEARDAAFGPGSEAKGKAARDFAQLAQIAAVASGANGPRTGPAVRSAPIRIRAPDVASEPALVLPRAEDFRNAAAAISGTPASFQIEQKLLRLWTEHGISPTEAAADAMRDRTIAEDLRSDSGKLPDAYVAAGRPPAAAGAEPGAPDQPVTPAEADRMTAAAENQPGAAETEVGAEVDPTAPERAPMTAESKAVGMYPPPLLPQRPFKFDYRWVVPQTDPTGRLLVDMEGRPLVARYVAGRRFAGERDYPLTPADVDAAIMGLDIRKVPTPSIPNNNDSVVGLFTGYEDKRGRPVGDLYVKSTTSAADQHLVTAHELGHAIDYITDLASTLTNPELDELRRVYATLRGGAGRKTLHPQPETYGYEGENINQELLVEGIRAYLTNPNYFKAAAPRSAARIREAVNKDKWLKRIIQFNSLGAAGVVGAGAAGSHDEDGQ
jgi:hypothetical protein